VSFDLETGHNLYQPDTPHENILDALAEHCGIQWGLKKPMAEAIVAYFIQHKATPAPQFAVRPITLPSAEDLDAVAKEAEIKAATSSPEPVLEPTPAAPESTPEEKHEQTT
jgi:hypothetical protein